MEATAPGNVGIQSRPSGGLKYEKPAPLFENLTPQGGRVDARQCIAEGTTLWVVVAAIFGLIGFIFAIAASFGVALLLLPIGIAIDWVRRRRVYATIRGNHLKVTEYQLPELYQCARVYAQRLGMAEVPEIFVGDANTVNGVAFRIFGRRMIVLTDDLLWGAQRENRPHVAAFTLAHELAHHALGHTKGLRSYLSRMLPVLSRHDELSADAVALQLLGDRQGAYESIAMLTVGPQLMAHLNFPELMKQAESVAQDRLWKKAEGGHTHPLLLRRLDRLRHIPLARR